MQESAWQNTFRVAYRCQPVLVASGKSWLAAAGQGRSSVGKLAVVQALRKRSPLCGRLRRKMPGMEDSTGQIRKNPACGQCRGGRGL